MKTFVQIEQDPADASRSLVHWKFEAESNPYPPTVDIRDVTDVSPPPGEGWAANDDGSFTEPVAPEAAKPNNPGNPYFGKKPLTPKAFWGLVLQVYIALANGDKGAGLDRQARLLTSNRAVGILKIIDGVSLIDVDDKDGDFLSLLNILTTTNHEDGGLLMELQEAGAIMQGWR